MNLPQTDTTASPEPPGTPAQVLWTLRDTWLGFGLVVLLVILAVIAVFYFPREEFAQVAAMILVESIYLIPIAVILGWKRIHWRYLGFTRFNGDIFGIGCGLLIGAYALILIHNLTLYRLGIRTQGDMISQLIQSMGSPGWLILVGTVLAPLVEEMFFRGFLFPGFRQSYGWVKALILSSGLFALAHVDLASLLPTFLLGCVLTYVYHKSNSLWPGIILHFLVNAFGLCATFAALELSKYYPGLALYSFVINLTWLS